MLITSAMAQAATQPAAQEAVGSFSGMRTIVQLALIFIIFYLFLIRPQQKRAKEHEKMLNAIEKGTQVVVGGVMGKVVQVLNDQEVLVEISTGVQVKVLRPYISQVIREMDIIEESKRKSEKE